MNESREQAFLTRLWELQDEARLSDAALARAMGVNQSLVWRAKHDPARTFGIKFALGACDTFPELRVLLFGNIPVGTGNMTNGTDEARRREVSAMLRLGDGGGY